MKFVVGITPLSPDHVCLLKKFIYGFKKASKQWYSRLITTLNFKRFSHPLNDYSLFFKKSHDSICIIAIYVDDFLSTGDNI